MAAEHLDHGRSPAQSGLQLFYRVHFDDLHAESAGGMIVHIARLARHDHFILQAFEVGQPLHFLRIRAGNAACRGVSGRRGRAGGHNSPLHLEQFRQALAHLIHQLIEVHMEVGCLLDRGNDFRQHLRAAVDGQGRGGVDERPDSDPGVYVRFGCAGGCGGRRRRGCEAGRRGHTAAAEKIATAQSGNGLLCSITHFV